MNTHNRPGTRILVIAVVLGLSAAACASADRTVSLDEATSTATESTEPLVEAEDESSETTEAGSDDTTDGEVTASDMVTFTAEVWADNWFALYVNGELVGEDSVPITTERSFNAETITFETAYPLTIAIQAKDFKETDSGLEYIGENNQQMGDGGIIAQITDESTGEVVAVTGSAWSALVVHRAPLNTDCEDATDPDATCEFEITEIPADWTSADFDDSGWVSGDRMVRGGRRPEGRLRRDRLGLIGTTHLGNRSRSGQHDSAEAHDRRLTCRIGGRVSSRRCEVRCDA